MQRLAAKELAHTRPVPLTRLLHACASYTPLTRLLHPPLTRLLHASYTPFTRLLHASYTPKALTIMHRLATKDMAQACKSSIVGV
jgi:hypothetical protein